MRIRHFPLLCLCVALSACNAATSDRPLFNERQRSSALILEDGLWLSVDADCKVDVNAPTKRWPKCANWMIVSGNKVVAAERETLDEPWDVFIVDGTPPIIQIKNKEDVGTTWTFIALIPKDYSPTQKLIALDYRLVPCGTEDPADPSGMKIRPYPGFNEKCITTSVDALRAAAAKPPGTSSSFVQWRWVRAEAR